MARRRRRADLDSPFWWIVFLSMLAVWVVILGAWLVWAIIALPIAGVAKLCHNDGLARSMVRGLRWNIGDWFR